jgi:hypothetical protein
MRKEMRDGGVVQLIDDVDEVTLRLLQQEASWFDSLYELQITDGSGEVFCVQLDGLHLNDILGDASKLGVKEQSPREEGTYS